MGEDVLSLSAIGRLMRRQWRWLAALAVLGALIGAAASLFVWPPKYQSQTQVLFGGKPDQSEDKSSIQTQAQVAMSLVVLDRTARGLNWGVDGSGLRDDVTAAVVNGSVIEIQATAGNPEKARQLADRVTQEYIAFSGEIVTKTSDAARGALTARKADLQRQVDDLNRQIGDAQRSVAQPTSANPQNASAPAELQHLESIQADAVKALNEVDTQIAQTQAKASVGQSSIIIIEPATTPTGPVTLTLVQLSAAAAAIAVVLGTFVMVAVQRADRRLRRSRDIASALGAPLVGTVGPPEPAVPQRTARRLGRDAAGMRRHSRPHREQSLDNLRYQRALARLSGASGRSARLLVLVVNDDYLAVAAVARATLVIAATDRPISLVTDSPRLTGVVEAMAVANRPGPAPLTVVAGLGATQSLRTNTSAMSVVAVSTTLPTVPHLPGDPDILVVVTSGTRTAADLIALAEACQDAGHPVTGVLTVVPNAKESGDASEPPPLGSLALVPREGASGGRL